MNEPFRLFFALWPDNETRFALSEIQALVSGRLVPFDNLHATLVFLGDQPESVLSEMKEILDQAPASPIKLTLDKAGYFPQGKITWAGMKKIPSTLNNLHKALTTYLRKKNIAFDRRNRFLPHITLARHSEWINRQAFQPVEWNANTLCLVRSEFRTNRKGAHPVYTPLFTRQLK